MEACVMTQVQAVAVTLLARVVFHVEENRERHASGPIQLRPATTITTTNITTNE